jgi:hypothetical protein
MKLGFVGASVAQPVGLGPQAGYSHASLQRSNFVGCRLLTGLGLRYDAVRAVRL